MQSMDPNDVEFTGMGGLKLATLERIYGITTNNVGSLIGSVMEKIEMLGLSEKQEIATKRAIKHEIWRFNREVLETLKLFLDQADALKFNQQIGCEIRPQELEDLDRARVE